MTNWNLRYDRQERLSLWSQEIIQDSKVLVVGVGGTGSEVVKNLSLLGIGNMVLVDQDTIEISNLNRQLLFTASDIGQSKAIVAKQRVLERYNPDVNVEVFATSIQNVPTRVLEEVDIIAGCVDNWLARQYLNSLAIELNKILIDSATDGYYGQVRAIIKHETACLACDNPQPPDETQTLSAPCSLVGRPRERNHCLWKALYLFCNEENTIPDENDPEKIELILKLSNKIAQEYNYSPFTHREVRNIIAFHVPALITVNSVISGIQSQEVIKGIYLTKINSLDDRMRNHLKQLIANKRFRINPLTIYSALSGTINTFDLTPDPQCTVCSTEALSKTEYCEVSLPSKAKVSDLVEKLKTTEDFVAFKANYFIDPETELSTILESGDRITLSFIKSDREIRVKIVFSN